MEVKPLPASVSEYWTTIGNKGCTACPLYSTAHTVCMSGSGNIKAKAMIIFGSPDMDDDNNGKQVPSPAMSYLKNILIAQNIDLKDLYITYATKCTIPESYSGKPEATLKNCTPLYLEKEIEDINPKVILALGPISHYFFKHRNGLSKNRGQTILYNDIKVIPTYAPDYVLVNPQYDDLFNSDIAKFGRILNDVDMSPKISMIEVFTLDDFDKAMVELESNKDKILTFDTETRGLIDYLPEYSKMWNLAITQGIRDEKGIRTFGFPLEHPDSPFVDNKEILTYMVHRLADLLFNSKVNNHNVIFDLRHFTRLTERYNYKGTRTGRIAFDTMVAAHSLNEELPLNLLNVAGSELGVDNWGKGIQYFGNDGHPPSALWGEDGMLSYCVRDTAYTHMVYERQVKKLATRQASAKLLKNLILPGMEAILQMQLNGIWVDPEKVAVNLKELSLLEKSLNEEVMSYIPEEFRELADLGNDHFLRKWLFGPSPEGLSLRPISYTEKTKIPQVNEAVLRQLDHPATESLVELKKTTKLIQFFTQWQDFIDNDNRMHPYFNLTGTVTGRRSCDGPNLQQVPRDSRLRSCLGAPEGWTFIEVDYSMVEVRLAAWFANEETLLDIFAKGGDAYKRIASLIMKIPIAEVTKQQRQEAKAIVLGFQYGMGANKFGEYAKDTFGVKFTLEQSKEFRKLFFDTFPGLVRWHEKTKAYVKKNHRIESPIGRNRNLIRVLSSDSYMQWKATAQGINSGIQGLGGDLTLNAMNELNKIMPLEEGLLVGDIHDAVLFQVRKDVAEKWALKIVSVMENPVILEKYGIIPPVKLTANVKIGQYWSEGIEYTVKEGVLVEKE